MSNVNHFYNPDKLDSLPPYSPEDGEDVWVSRKAEELFNEYRIQRDRVEEIIAEIETYKPLADLLLCHTYDVEMKMDRFVYELGTEVGARIRIDANEAAKYEWDTCYQGHNESNGGQHDDH